MKRHERTALAAIARALDTPVMADESIFDPREALAGVEMRLADIFALKIMKSGGIRRALEVAAIARLGGIDVYGGCMFETGIAHAAGAQLMAALPDLTLGCEFYMSTYYAREDILTEPFPVRDGLVHVPDGAGARRWRWTPTGSRSTARTCLSEPDHPGSASPCPRRHGTAANRVRTISRRSW